MRADLAALPLQASAVMVGLADQPLLEEKDLTVILDAWKSRAPGVQLMVPCLREQPGHPLIFPPASE
ncbi:NTP transferase domain-containing protein [bacterium BD-1]|nr:NTP transferase domain-containing protein [Ottowia caeni]